VEGPRVASLLLPLFPRAEARREVREKRNEKAKIAGGWRDEEENEEKGKEEMKTKMMKKKEDVEEASDAGMQVKGQRGRECTGGEISGGAMVEAVEKGKFKLNFYSALAWANSLFLSLSLSLSLYT